MRAAPPFSTPSPPPSKGRPLALWLATLGQRWRAEAADRMPTATGDIREIVGQPVFVPLYRLFVVYGKVCAGEGGIEGSAGVPRSAIHPQPQPSRTRARALVFTAPCLHRPPTEGG